MAFVQATYWSPVLGKQTSLYALIPQRADGPFPVFYLLHGLSDDHTIWQRRTRIESYAEGLPLIVVLPDGYRGFYTDHAEGPAYGRYMVEDVIGFVEQTFPAVGKRAGRCIGGLSMGGYGAIRLALAHPEMFVSAHSHSGGFYVYAGRNLEENREFRRIFGAHPVGSAHDPVALAAALKKKGQRIPKLRLDCGTEDFLIEENRKLHAEFTKAGVPHEYYEHPGTHNWDYWDLHIREALAFHARCLGIAPKTK